MSTGNVPPLTSKPDGCAAPWRQGVNPMGAVKPRCADALVGRHLRCGRKTTALRAPSSRRRNGPAGGTPVVADGRVYVGNDGDNGRSSSVRTTRSPPATPRPVRTSGCTGAVAPASPPTTRSRRPRPWRMAPCTWGLPDGRVQVLLRGCLLLAGDQRQHHGGRFVGRQPLRLHREEVSGEVVQEVGQEVRQEVRQEAARDVGVVPWAGEVRVDLPAR